MLCRATSLKAIFCADSLGVDAITTVPASRWDPVYVDPATTAVARFYCRRGDAARFRAAGEEGNKVARLLAPDMDAVLHRERLDHRKKRLHPLPAPLNRLPDGAMVRDGEDDYLLARGRALKWSPAGYSEAAVPESATLLTPPSTLRALGAGYRPVLHPSAQPVPSPLVGSEASKARSRG